MNEACATGKFLCAGLQRMNKGASVSRKPSQEKVVLIHSAGSAIEAMVIRGLLESAGIASSGSSSTDPFPMDEPHEGIHTADVMARESQAAEARRIIAEYLKNNEGLEIDESENSSEEKADS
jgi:hypothetical protein